MTPKTTRRPKIRTMTAFQERLFFLIGGAAAAIAQALAWLVPLGY
jgi:hypothetical protein